MTAPLQLVTPPGAAAQASAILIASLLKQEQVELTADALNQEFFGVLADFEKQAVRSGLNGADNPFTQLSAELVQWMHQQAAGRRTATDVPAEFSEEIGRSRHMREEAAHNPGLLVIVVRMLEKLAARPELAAHPRVHAEVLKELGSAYAELPVADRQRAVTRICTCRKWGRCETPQWVLRALHLSLRWHLRRTIPRPAGAR